MIVTLVDGWLGGESPCVLQLKPCPSCALEVCKQFACGCEHDQLSSCPAIFGLIHFSQLFCWVAAS